MSETKQVAMEERIQLTQTAVSDDITTNDHQNGTTPQSADVDPPPVDRDSLRTEIQQHLEAMGLNDDRPNGVLSKEAIRHIHRFHREAAQQRIRQGVGQQDQPFLGRNRQWRRGGA